MRTSYGDAELAAVAKAEVVARSPARRADQAGRQVAGAPPETLADLLQLLALPERAIRRHLDLARPR